MDSAVYRVVDTDPCKVQTSTPAGHTRISLAVVPKNLFAYFPIYCIYMYMSLHLYDSAPATVITSVLLCSRHIWHKHLLFHVFQIAARIDMPRVHELNNK